MTPPAMPPIAAVNEDECKKLYTHDQSKLHDDEGGTPWSGTSWGGVAGMTAFAAAVEANVAGTKEQMNGFHEIIIKIIQNNKIPVQFSEN